MISVYADQAADATPVVLVGERRLCQWCGSELSPMSRVDALTCGQRCRQARHRLRRVTRRVERAATPMRFAYADPPYPGRAKRIYGRHHDYAGEVDHEALVEVLYDGYPDGWALSTAADSLPAVLAVCPPTVRVGAWVRGAVASGSTRPLASWEPVIYHGGRVGPGLTRRLDSLVHGAKARTTDPRWVTGAKPATFAFWLFELLGAGVGDTFVDLFPGSGRMAEAWAAFTDPSHGAGDNASLADEHDRSSVDECDASPPGLPDASFVDESDVSAAALFDASPTAENDAFGRRKRCSPHHLSHNGLPTPRLAKYS